ncbi:MAG: SAM-dependent methyltransferase [Verrucomicrobiota bacterium]
MSKPAPAESFIAKTVASLDDGSFVRLTLSSPTQVDLPLKVLGRAVKLRGTIYLSLTLRHPTRDVTQNLSMPEVAAWLQQQLGQNFRSALLGTTSRDWQFISNEAGAARLVDHKPAKKIAPPPEHDQKATGFLDASARDWLTGLSVLDRDGKLRASMADKHRQINHYLEIVSHLAKECGWNGAPITASARSSETLNEPNRSSTFHLVDMGCGKGYLTFGLWHLFARTWKQPVRVTGVESRADLVNTTSTLARQIRAEGLEFVRGEIASAKLEQTDALIALHACNTATDDAIRRGIELGAKLIIVAPCCHKEARPQLGKPEPLAPVLRHGIMAERMAEWATDGLRALFLEWAGYRTKLMEFIGGEHTPKNLMIAAVREREPFRDETVRAQIVALKQFLGINQHALDMLLNTER